MSLDRNLFTLNVVPNGSNPAVQDLILLLPGTVHYHKEREAGSSYRINLFGAPRSSLVLIGGGCDLTSWTARTRPNVSKPACLRNGAECHEQAQNNRALQSFPNRRIQVNWHTHL